MKFDSVRRTLVKHADALDQQLATQLEPTSSSMAVEIRNHVKSLKPGERLGFLNERIKAGDSTTARAVLGTVPPYLSGVDDQQSATMTRVYNERAYPELVKRLDTARKVIGMLEARGGSFLLQVPKAFGQDGYHKVARIRAAADAVNKAMTWFL